MLSDRNPEILWKVLNNLIKEEKILKNYLKLNLVGNVSFEVKESIKKYSLESYVEYVGHIPYDQTSKYLKNSQILLLIQTNKLESAILDEQILPDLVFCFNNQLNINRISEKQFSLLLKRVYIINEEKIPGDLMDELIRLNLNYKIIPITVPKNPIMGAAPEIVARTLTFFSRL